MGAMVGPAGEIEVIAVAKVFRNTSVFMGFNFRIGEYVCSTFTEGEREWHNGYYRRGPHAKDQVMSRFLSHLDPTWTVYRP